MAMATQLLFVPITAFTKVSILLTYLRMTSDTLCSTSAHKIFRNFPLTNKQELLLHPPQLHCRVVHLVFPRGFVAVQVSSASPLNYFH
jgi:hypothetical protein